LLLAAMVCSCSYYSFSGSLPPHLETIAIPLFDNSTPEFGVAEDLTDTVIQEFTRDNSLKIADRQQADLVLEGEINRIDDRAGAFDENEQVQNRKLYMTVRVKCTDQVKKQILWEDRITRWGEYDPVAGPDARLQGIDEAIDKISQDILNKTVSGW
jgi:hypothetical protein